MNRAERRRIARKHGWKGAKSKKGTSFIEALKAADAALKSQEQEQEQAERQAYIEKIQKAAVGTRELGLVIPGQ